jgi:amidohydrolase
MKLRTISALIALVAASTPALAQDLRAQLEPQLPSLMDLYRDMHANPELSTMEVTSAARMAREARAAGFDVTTGVGGHGVVAVMRNGPGPVLLIRADMDGLPVTEATGLPYASTVRVTTAQGVETGVMHACGHDTHMTGWIGAARLLAANKGRWSGTLVMIGQPAEETVGGADAMLADGLFTRFPKPTHAIAFHDAAGFPAGMIGYTPGFALANVDTVDVLVRGVGGHGAYPHNTRDTVLLGARIVDGLQSIVSRNVDPQDAAVVTVGSFHSGTRHNIIPDEARLQLTVRSYRDDTRAMLLEGIRRVARGEAIAAGVPEDRMPEVMVDTTQAANATFNTPDFTENMAAHLRRHFGDARVMQVPPSMGAEDFGNFYRADTSIKTMIFWVGGTPLPEWQAAQANKTPLPSLHSPFWAPDAEAVVATASEALASLAMEILKPAG